MNTAEPVMVLPFNVFDQRLMPAPLSRRHKRDIPPAVTPLGYSCLSLEDFPLANLPPAG
jgi:hypothetical protein